ncbi:hypothetical protein K491DRAFT_699041 [Lophiostoma macrostomum CBS 122681]|uniref:MAPEG-domain-containing protein n=1 Tax=Lophiostoma macrostomum CBS 122681 TaxID=1314788 RepID=A0A6A6SMV1_9PLEO|nr:hypothetical protein K491DRAFT_699041 [Lophiostoma macrostomum CBS 122681]
MSSTNYSLYTIPIAYVIGMVPRLFSIRTYSAASKKTFPYKRPRTLLSLVQNDQSLDRATKNKILYAEAAHANSMENIAIFAAAVGTANAVGVDKEWVNAISAAYVVLRFIYNHVYIFQDSLPILARTAVHHSAAFAVMTLFVLAGNEVNRK